MTNNARIGSFDAVKAFAMFLVIWGHCIMHLTNVNKVDDTTFVFINSFHMPLFMIMAGYFSSSSLKMNFKPLLFKKFKELFVPAMCWGIIVYMVMIFFEKGGNMVKFLDYFLMKYWFLRSLFCCYLLAFVVIKIPRWLAFIIICCSLFVTLYKINLMFPAFLCGLMMRQHNALENVKITGWKNILIIALVFITLTLFYDAHFLNTPNRMLTIIDSNSLIAWVNYLYKTLYRIVVGISGALIVIIMFHKYLKGILGVICKIGQKTLGIYLIQGLLLERLLPRFYQFDGGGLFDIVIAPLLSVLFLYVCYYIVIIIEKNKKISIILLGR